ncbi:L-serine ammonia-lyase, iron-sulfur-dependent, subunit alpha [Crassaminicella profunda]|uniref:L-serine ammonia-lyase, iron-sulfur-dependent, subunit alpha n=1 Tax=Crassaminicella profunda TaxID=1286698 RepID=UPI001CA6079A|nr:L-serine ammonia-lyase, iron-sulfur-dependent, subunit alpha [Crassaminicella profunda]QZY54017.1 L-serine ammonia-lyase, iron-sulfur-dependent, subunit alpha [Crassaminicella profunda]
MSYNFNCGNELIELCHKHNKKIWEIMLCRESKNSGENQEKILEMMKENLKVMKSAIIKGLKEDIKSVSGLVGGDAKLLDNRYKKNNTVSGSKMMKAVASAMAVVEVNASMGQVVAAPTAGSCGILPGVLISVGEDFNLCEDELVKGLFTASAIGLIIAKNATVSGAEGGCQAETGAAAAMAAGAVVELLGGTVEEVLHGAAMTMKNILGLVCDPIAGLVECPCVKRNAIGTANALISADMALAGIKSVIPFDEVVEAMYKVGKSLPETLRETALGGLADTPTGRKLAKEIFNNKK